MFKKQKLKQIISAAALMSVASIAAAAPSITLTQTVGLDTTSGACAASSVVVATLADSVNFCYTVTNDGDAPFDLHAVSSDIFGTLSPAPTGTLAPTESMQFNDIRTLASDVFNTGTWDASNPAAVTVTPAVPSAFEDISGTGTEVTGSGSNAGADGGLADDGEADLTLPFAFTFFGTTSTDLCVGNNGAAFFGVTGCSVDYSNHTLTAADAGMIAPFWDDLGYNDTVGTMYTETKGTAPNRHYIVQWDKEVYYAFGGTTDTENITFQVAFFEGSNEIQFRYFDVTFGGGTASHDAGATAIVGMVAPDGSVVSSYSDNGSTPLAANEDVNFTFVPGPAASASSVAAVNVLVPQVVANPNSSLDPSVEEGMSTTGTLDISNSGEGTLNWTLDEAAGSGMARMQRPLSFYTPEIDYTASQYADIKTTSEKSTFSAKPKKIILGANASVAYAFDLRNGSFGTVDHTNPGAFNEIVPNADAFYAGDFIGQDYTKLYAVKDDNNLYTIDTTTGATTMIAAITGGAEVDGVSGLSEDSTDGTVYASTTTGTNSYLYTLDVVTGVSTLIGEVTNSPLLIDIAVSLTGDIYGLDISTDSLIAIDKITGAGTVVGAIGFNASFAQGMDFDNSTNTLYITGYTGGGGNSLSTVDLTTGVATVVGSVSAGTDGAEMDSFAIAADVELCAVPENITWMSLSATSGATNAGNMDQVTVSFDATGLSAGIYTANVCLFSDDPDESLVKVPVSLTVTLPDLIFKNGFE